MLKTCGSLLGLGTGVLDAGGDCSTPGSYTQMDNNSEEKLDSDLIRNRNKNMSCWFSHGFSKLKDWDHPVIS